jgi:hypothetical protein
MVRRNYFYCIRYPTLSVIHVQGLTRGYCSVVKALSVLALTTGKLFLCKMKRGLLARTTSIHSHHLPKYHDSSLGFWLSQRSMLYELLQFPLPCGFELASVTERSLPSSTCIDDERDTERGADVCGTCFGELFFWFWLCVSILEGVAGFLSACAVRLASHGMYGSIEGDGYLLVTG